MVQMKIKISTLLMEAGVSFHKQRLHKAGYFRELLATNPDIKLIPPSFVHNPSTSRFCSHQTLISRPSRAG